MKKYLSIFLLISMMCSCDHTIKHLPYPKAAKGNVVDDYFGTQVADPYRWLEDDKSPETETWVAEENKVTENYFSQVPFRDKLRARITELWDYPRVTTPVKKGDYYYFYKNDGLQNQPVLYRQKGLDGKPAMFFDPNTLSSDGTVAMESAYFSNDNRLMAYSISRSGSDWREFFVIDTQTGKQLEDHIQWAKFTGAEWAGNGFYYSRYDEPSDATKKYSEQNRFHKIYYHTIGTPQSEDKLIYMDSEHPLRYFSAQVTDDEEFLIITASEGTSGTELYYSRLSGYSHKITPLIKGFSNNHAVIDHHNGKLLVLTDYLASNYRLVSIDPEKPDPENWTDVIPETVELLESVSTGGGKLFAFYLKDASTKIVQMDYQGKIDRCPELPAIGTVSGLSGKRDENILFYSFASFNRPSTVFLYNLETGKSNVFMQPELKFNPDDYIIEQVFYISKDGTRVPMFLVHKQNIELNGKNPMVLYAYGGFNVSMTPSFNAARIAFLEKGGIYAMPNIRGGGEYGEEWHQAGMLEKKQNVFNDFIAAAEYLIKEKYTSSTKLAINGGSNGGLLVGAVMTQRPELFQVALPAVGVMDMLRYQKFTIGWGWMVEYGSSDKEDEFAYLYKYSPLHNIKSGVSYPATLVTTADHDDRVVPAHSFKFAATLQEKNSGHHPILIRIDKDAGHGAGKSTSKAIEEATDVWSFVFYQLGMEF